MKVPISKLKANPSNPRVLRDDKFTKLKASIESFPDMLNKRPIVAVTDADGKYMVLGGNMRLRACQDLKMKEVPVILADEWTEEQRREFIIKDNVGFGEWDWDALANEWDSNQLQDWGLDFPTSFGEENEISEETEEDVIHEVPSNPVTVKGDVWQLGKHRILCGDCMDFNGVENLLKGAKINVAFTSPPYASQRKYDETSGFKPIPPEEYVEWYKDVAANIMVHLASDGSYFCNIKEHCEDGQRSLYVKDLTLAHVREWGWMFVDEFAWTRQGVPGGFTNRFKNGWEPVFHFSTTSKIKFREKNVCIKSDQTFGYSKDNKKSGTGSGLFSKPADGYADGFARPSNVLNISTGGGHYLPYAHSAAFPVALPEFFIKAYSDDGDIIFDPFMGSGTTLIAAEKNGRIGYGIEISPAYCDLIVKRWQDFTGQKAIHEVTGKTFDEVSETGTKQGADAKSA